MSDPITPASIAALVSSLPLGQRHEFVCKTFAGMGQDGLAYVRQCLAKNGTPADKASAIMAGAHYFSRRCDCEKDGDAPLSGMQLGAGPGPTQTFDVDLPLPWGKDTPVTLPVQALADSFGTAMQPRLDAAVKQIQAAVTTGVSVPVNQAADKVSVATVVISLLIGTALGIVATKEIERRRREKSNG